MMHFPNALIEWKREAIFGGISYFSAINYTYIINTVLQFPWKLFTEFSFVYNKMKSSIIIGILVFY